MWLVQLLMCLTNLSGSKIHNSIFHTVTRYLKKKQSIILRADRRGCFKIFCIFVSTFVFPGFVDAPNFASIIIFNLSGSFSAFHNHFHLCRNRKTSHLCVKSGKKKPIKWRIKVYWAKLLLTWPLKYPVSQLNNPLSNILISCTPQFFAWQGWKCDCISSCC